MKSRGQLWQIRSDNEDDNGDDLCDGGVFPRLRAGAGGGSSDNEELWMSIERYLLAAYTALHEGDEAQLKPLKTPKHRMGWYATIYNACNGNPANSRELYARLALAILHALQAFVLYPMLQHADRSRLVLITGQEGSPAGTAPGSGGRGRSSDPPRSTLKSSVQKSSSFHFVRRLFFGDADGRRHHQQRDTSGKPGRSKGDTSLQSFSETVPGLTLSLTTAGIAEQSSPIGHSTAVSTPFVGFQSPLQLWATSRSGDNAVSPLSIRGAEGSGSTGNLGAPGSGRNTPPQQQRQNSLQEINFVDLAGERSLARSPTPTQQRWGTGFLSRQHSMATSADHAGQPHSPALVSEDTGRVLVEEEEELLPDHSRTPPESNITLPSTPAPSLGKRSVKPGGTAAGPPANRTAAAVAVNTAADRTSPEMHVHANRGSPPAASVGSGGGVGGGSGVNTGPRHDGQNPHYSPCRTFCEEYATFAVFRRIVLSCFRYLDQYYTRRFGMDTLTMMCVKLFYVIVYEPVKPLLMDELFARLNRLREAHSSEAHNSLALVKATSRTLLPSPAGSVAGSLGDGNNAALPAASSRPGTEFDLTADVQLVQQTLAVVTELIVAVQTTASYLVASDAPVTGGGSGSGTTVKNGANSGRQSPPVRGLVGAPSRAGGNRTPAAHSGAVVNTSFASEVSALQPAAVSRSAPTSVASTPRFHTFDPLVQSPGTPTAAMAASSASSASAVASPVAAPAVHPPPPKENRRRRLIDLFKSNHHNKEKVASSGSGSASASNLRNSGEASSVVPATTLQASTGTDFIDATSALVSHFGDDGGRQQQEQVALTDVSPSAVGQEGCTSDDQPDSGSRGRAPVLQPIVVDLRGTVELRNRLESRSLAHSLANQAIRHCELCGDNAGGGNTGNQGTSQPQLLTGTIIKEIGKPLTSLIADDFGDKYVLVLEQFYRSERTRHINAVDLHRSYVRWVRSVFALEDALLQNVAVSFIHAAIHDVLSSVLLVEVHRSIILDDKSGFRRLLEVWAGDLADDTLIVAILGEGAFHGRCINSAAAGNANSASTTMNAVFNPLNLSAPHSRTFSSVLDYTSNNASTSGTATQSDPNYSGIQSHNGGASGVNAARSVEATIPVHTRTLSSASSAKNGSLATLLSPSTPYVTKEDQANAVGYYYSTFALANDESCRLLMATVLASKVIQDCAELFSVYLKHITLARRRGNPQTGGVFSDNSRSNGRGAGLPSFPARFSSEFLSPQSSLARTSRTSRMRQRSQAAGTNGVASPQSVPTPEAIVTVAGDALAEKLVNVFTNYTTLIRRHIPHSPVLLGALRDAMVVVLNPARWPRSGAAAAASEMASSIGTGCGREGNEGSGVGPRGQQRERLPNVLLNRDAGARAAAPLRAILASEPLATSLSTAVLLAAYCDHLFARQLPGSDVPKELQERLAYIAQMVTLFDDKDVFLEYHKEKLARRLLSTKASLELERAFIQQLQLSLGVGSVHAFEAMLRDCVNTKGCTAEFEKTDGFRGLATSIAVQLVSSAQWPSYCVIGLKPHPSLSAGMAAFESFYLSLHPSRTLRWVHLLGTARLGAEFPRGNKEVIANTLQATVLLVVSDACNAEVVEIESNGDDGALGGEFAEMTTKQSEGAIGVEAVPVVATDHRSEDSPTTVSYYSSQVDREDVDDVDDENDATRDMYTVGSFPSFIHGAGEGSPTPKATTDLTPSFPRPPDGAAASATAPSYSSSLAAVAGPRLTTLFANLTSSAISTYRRARVDVGLDDDDEEEDEESGNCSKGNHAVDEGASRSFSRGPPHHQRTRGSITGGEIARRMGLTFPEVRPHLASVVLLRGVPMIKCLSDDKGGACNTTGHNGAGRGGPASSAAPAPRLLQPTDRFTLNEHFAHPLRKIRLPMPCLRRVTATLADDGASALSNKVWALGGGPEGGGAGTVFAAPRALFPTTNTAERSTESASAMACGSNRAMEGADVETDSVFTRVPVAVQAARRQELDAAIVRIMKSHREVAYHDLIAMVTQHVSRRFVPSTRDIKRELETLVEREFIRRSQTDISVFVYNA